MQRRKKEKASIRSVMRIFTIIKKEDCLICPMGQRMDYAGKRYRKTENGYTLELSRYKAKNCEGCPLRGACHKGAGERIIEISHTGERTKTEGGKINTPNQRPEQNSTDGER